MSDKIDFFDVGEVTPKESTLEELTALAEEASALEQQINEEMIETERKNKRLQDIKRGRIPEIMQSLGMSAFRLSDGSELSVENKLNASIKPENKDIAYRWLDEHGFGGIIKTKITSDFDRSERENAEKARQLLVDAGFAAIVESSIHNATLKSFVKERLAAAGEEIEHETFGDEPGDTEKSAALPLDIFSVFEYKEAKIKAAKAPRKSSKK